MRFLDGFVKGSEQEVCPMLRAKILAIVLLLLFLALNGIGAPSKRIVDHSLWVVCISI